MLLLPVFKYLRVLAVLQTTLWLTAAALDAGDEAVSELQQTLPSIVTEPPIAANGSAGLDTSGGRPWRLPNSTYPLRYHLHLTTHVHRHIYEYSANCTIEILVRESSPELVLHSEGLQIQHISVDDLTTQAAIPSVVHTQVRDLLIVGSENSSSAAFERDHRLRLVILYTGVIGRSSVGFHKLSYEDANNRTVFGASTQLEPIYARTVLPCYDEPAYKSNFTVSITHGSNYTAISNMPQVGVATENSEHMTTTTFMETPPMSTYLLAFVISNFKCISAERDGVHQRVFMPPNTPKDVQPALQNALLALKVFGDFLEVPYVLPKLDHIAVRESYGDAMENWGLITYNDHGMLKRNESDVVERFRQTFTQHHELVHQWFGNLVTPAWWNYVWLSEGFASYYSYVLTDMLTPEYSAIDAFNINICFDALALQERASISEYVETPDEIGGVFDAVVYNRAPCIIQMFDHALQQDVFRKGVSIYLKEHAYSVATEDNLYEALQTAIMLDYAKKNLTWSYSVHEIMKSWTQSKGYPMLTVTRNYHDNTIHLQQRPLATNSTQLWWIPLNFATASQPNFEQTAADFFMPPIAELTISLSSLNITLNDQDWVMVNKLAKGFYHLKYDAENLRRISVALAQDNNAIHKLQRVQLLRSLMSCLSHMESVELSTVLEILKSLRNEDEPFVWSAARDPLMELLCLLQGTKLEQLFKNFMRNIIGPSYVRYKAMAVQTINLEEAFLVDDLEELACQMELHECLMDRRAFVLMHMAAKIDDEDEYMINMSLCNAAKVFSDEEFAQALEFYMHSKMESSWHLLICTKSDAQYEQLLEAAFHMDTNETHCISKFHFLADLLQSKHAINRNVTWLMFDKHIQTILNSTACKPELFYKRLVHIAPYIVDTCVDKYLSILELTGHANLLQGPTIGTQVKNRSWFQHNINDEELYKWLESENELIEHKANKR